MGTNDIPNHTRKGKLGCPGKREDDEIKYFKIKTRSETFIEPDRLHE